MIRTALAATTLTIGLTFSLTLPAAAQNDDAECRKQGQIATNIMTERKNGANAQRAERRVIRMLPEDAKSYEVAIPALVQWIYSLPEEHTTEEVSNALYQNCLSQ